jgi:hypothetical protein
MLGYVTVARVEAVSLQLLEDPVSYANAPQYCKCHSDQIP